MHAHIGHYLSGILSEYDKIQQYEEHVSENLEWVALMVSLQPKADNTC
jgi:hypothetical protein